MKRRVIQDSDDENGDDESNDGKKDDGKNDDDTKETTGKLVPSTKPSITTTTTTGTTASEGAVASRQDDTTATRASTPHDEINYAEKVKGRLQQKLHDKAVAAQAPIDNNNNNRTKEKDKDGDRNHRMISKDDNDSDMMIIPKKDKSLATGKSTSNSGSSQPSILLGKNAAVASTIAKPAGRQMVAATASDVKKEPSSLLSGMTKPNPSSIPPASNNAATTSEGSVAFRKQRQGNLQKAPGTSGVLGEHTSSSPFSTNRTDTDYVPPGSGGPATNMSVPQTCPSPVPPPATLTTEEQRKQTERSYKVKHMIWKSLHDLCNEMAQLQNQPFAAPTSNRVSNISMTASGDGPTERDGKTNSNTAGSNINTNDDTNTNKSSHKGIDTFASFLAEYRAPSGPLSLSSSSSNMTGINSGHCYDFFDVDETGCYILQPKIPMFPEDFPVSGNIKPWPLSWWGIVDPELNQDREGRLNGQQGKEVEARDEGKIDKSSSKDQDPTDRRKNMDGCDPDGKKNSTKNNSNDEPSRPLKRQRDERSFFDNARRPRSDNQGPSSFGRGNGKPDQDSMNDNRIHQQHPAPPPNRGGSNRQFPFPRGRDGPSEARPIIHHNNNDIQQQMEGRNQNPRSQLNDMDEHGHPPDFRRAPSGPNHLRSMMGQGHGPPPSKGFHGGGNVGGLNSSALPHRPLHQQQRQPFHNEERDRRGEFFPHHDPGPFFGADDRPPYDRNPRSDHPPPPPLLNNLQVPEDHHHHRQLRENDWDHDREYNWSPNRRREGPRRPGLHGEGEDRRSITNWGGRSRSDR